MRMPKCNAIVMGIALAFAGRALGQEVPQRVVNVNSMTVAELE